MRLRDYKETDIPAILAVIKEAFAEHKGKIEPPSSAEQKTVALVKAELESANALVAEVENKIVGCVFFQSQGQSLYIARLSLLQAYRKRGIASLMLTEIERRAKENGYLMLSLSVRVALLEQQAYYKRHGFEFEAYGTHAGYTQPTYIKMIKMIKPDKYFVV